MRITNKLNWMWPFFICLILVALMGLDYFLQTGPLYWISLVALFVTIKFFTVLYLITGKFAYPKLTASGIIALYLIFGYFIFLFSFVYWGPNYKVAQFLAKFGLMIIFYVLLLTIVESVILLLTVSNLSNKQVIGSLLLANTIFVGLYYLVPEFFSLFFRF